MAAASGRNGTGRDMDDSVRIPQNSIRMVGLQCGFSDVNCFIRLFKKTEGITPKVYRDCLMQGG